MVELLVVMGIMSVLSMLLLMQMERQARMTLAEAAGSELAQVHGAMDAFLSAYHSDIIGTDGSGNAVAMDPAITAYVSCAPSGSDRFCDVKPDVLAAIGLMPNNWTGDIAVLPNAGKWTIRIKVFDAPDGTKKATGMILSEKPFQLRDGIVDGALAGRSVLYSRLSSAGLVRPTTADETKLSFNARNEDFIIDKTEFKAQAPLPVDFITADYQFGAVFGNNVNQADSIYLRRDGSLPMLGDLNMGAVDATLRQALNDAGACSIAGPGTPCPAISQGFSIKLGNNITKFGGSLDVAQSAYIGGNAVVGADLSVRGSETVYKNLTVKGVSNLEGVTTIGLDPASGGLPASANILYVKNSQTVDGRIVVKGGGTSAAANIADVSDITGDTIESVIAGPKIHIRDAMVGELAPSGATCPSGDCRTSPYLSSLLPHVITVDTIVRHYHTGDPQTTLVIDKPVCPDDTRATKVIYVTPHVFFSTQDISVTVQRVGFNVYAEDLQVAPASPKQWLIHAYDADSTGYGTGATDLQDFSFVATVGCSYR